MHVYCLKKLTKIKGLKIFNYFRSSRREQSENFLDKIQKKLGLKITNKQIYKEAFTHSSMNLRDSNGKAINFERLEFLGDALLTTIVAEYLYDYFPQAKEGKLTKFRAKIVSRTNLNQIGKNMNLISLLEVSNNQNYFGDDIHGNILESLVGAVFLDLGYTKTKNYVIKKIITTHIDINDLESLVLSFKAILIEWGQKEKKNIEFVTQEAERINQKINYCTQIFLNKKLLANSEAKSKKKAEEKAAKIATHLLKLNTRSINY